MAELDYVFPAVGPLRLKPDTDIACEGAGRYYVTGYSALMADRYASITLELGETVPQDGYGLADYDGIIDALDRYFTVDVGNGVHRYLTNAATIIKHCFDRTHADGYRAARNHRPSVEWVASLVVVDAKAVVETVAEPDCRQLYRKIGIWLPYAQDWPETPLVPVIKSLRGGDTAAAFVALRNKEDFVHRDIELPDDIFEP